jgi:hypothetical protein
MKKSYTILWSFLFIFSLVFAGCKKKVKPLTERIAKSWSAETVKEGSVVVYSKGGAGNTQGGYAQFRLTLVDGGSAILIDRDNTAFTGIWQLTGDSKLTLKNLSPEPTGTGGTIEYTINSFDESKMVITRTTESIKTGKTINQYTLTNP